MHVELDLKPIIKESASLLCKIFYVEVKKTLYPEWVKGDANAGTLICASSEAMKSRRTRGVYKEGYHFKRKGDRIILWNRDALLEEWSVQNGKAMFSQM